MPDKKLGFGLMRLPVLSSEDRGQIDYDKLYRMVDTFLSRGFTYFDTAWMYHNFQSEPALKRAVIDRYPRDSFTVATKMPTMMLTYPKEQEDIFEQQLQKTGAGAFDYYLLHDLNVVTYKTVSDYSTIPYLEAQRAAGRIRKLGFSFHDSAAFLDKILTEHPDMDFVQLQINYLDWDNPGIQSRKCYETARRHGKPVIIMEPVKGGTLASLLPAAEKIFRSVHPDWSPASWAIRFAASLEGVMVVLSGMSTEEQLEDNTSYMQDFKPLTEEELKAVWQVRDILLNTTEIPCTGCRYCVEANTCPMNIPIPDFFALYNTEQQDTNGLWSPQIEYYLNLVTHGAGKASDCIRCRGCEAMCPQRLPITDLLEKVAVTLEVEQD
ncbi:MAG: aldo/keto reductase [Clostridia bacterium]|nr:aldo/keto reductase [Clostridia bacterium]